MFLWMMWITWEDAATGRPGLSPSREQTTQVKISMLPILAKALVEQLGGLKMAYAGVRLATPIKFRINCPAVMAEMPLRSRLGVISTKSMPSKRPLAAKP